jgi:S1-C subfamily serine protease
MVSMHVGESMSDKKITAVAVMCIMAIVFSGFNTYLILNSSSIQQEHFDRLQNDVEETESMIRAVEIELSSLNGTLSTFNVTELKTVVETLYSNLNELASELENLEGRMLQQTPAAVYETTYKSVVVVRTPLGQGSGFLYGNQNLILTNWHVVEDETEIEIEFYDRTRMQATLVGGDAYSDIAVIKVNSAPPDAEALQLGNTSELWIGQQVVAIGNPLGFTGSLSSGYISQINKLIDLPPLIVPVLQLDITIAPGSSGGPLLNLYGTVVGITNAGTSVGFNFAIPSNIMKRAALSLKENGYYQHPFVGFSGAELNPETIRELNILNVDSFQTGILVLEVVQDTPAEDAGLKGAVVTQAPDDSTAYEAMDIILEVDGHPMYTFEDWSSYVEEKVSPDQTITLTLWRSGEIVSIEVTTTYRLDYE